MHHRAQKVRINNVKNVIIATLNINSLVSKFYELTVIRQAIFDILIINETKLDASLLVNQSCINGFSTPYRLDRNWNGVGIFESYLCTRRYYMQNVNKT